MADIVDKATRSRMMSGIRGRDTRPEMTVRRYLHAAGLRFRLHRRDLPGCPDLVFPKYRAALFVHGCFWHRHAGCRFTKTPSTRRQFWLGKFESNVLRDRRQQRLLRRSGWKVIVVWECEVNKRSRLERLYREVTRAARA